MPKPPAGRRWKPSWLPKALTGSGAGMGPCAILGRVHALSRNATEAEVRACAGAWAPWRRRAIWHWWLALQTRTEV